MDFSGYLYYLWRRKSLTLIISKSSVIFSGGVMLFRIILPALLIFSNFTVAQWFWQNPLPQGNTLRSLWAFDSNNFVAVGDAGVFLKTNDAGLSFSLNIFLIADIIVD